MATRNIAACLLALGACGGPSRTMDAGTDASRDVSQTDVQVLGDTPQDQAYDDVSDVVSQDIRDVADVVRSDAVDVVLRADAVDVIAPDVVEPDAFICIGGGTVCSGTCVNILDSPFNCGRCDNVCPSPTGGHPGCSGGVCTQFCDPGEHLCASACVPDTSTDSCGALCTPCPTTPNGFATCDGMQCSLACDPGSRLVGSSCIPDPPRLVAPLSVATTTTPRPTLRWELGPALVGSHVEVCADRACAVIEQTHDLAANETSVRLRPLMPGAHFWRVSSHDRGGAEVPFGHTWEFFVGYTDTPVDSSWGTRSDFNGDGKDDLVSLETQRETSPGRANVYWGRAGGVGPLPDQVVLKDGPSLGPFGISIHAAPDVNGDGFTDLIVGGNEVLVYHGGPSGFSLTPSSRLAAPTGAVNFGVSVDGAGDLNGDGYGDFLCSTGQHTYVFLGSAMGLEPAPRWTLNPPIRTSLEYGREAGGAGDLNGDGYADLWVSAYSISGSTFRQFSCLHFGGPSGLNSMDCIIEGPGGVSVRSLGDVNGDGYCDIGTSSQTHIVATLGGSPWVGDRLTVWRVDSVDGVRTFGPSGDLDHDGKTDLVVGLHTVTQKQAYVFPGRDQGFYSTPSYVLSRYPGDEALHFGQTVLSRDLNADGYDDVLVSSVNYNGGTVFIYNGGPSALSTDPSSWLSSTGGGDFGRLIAALSPRRRFVLR